MVGRCQMENIMTTRMLAMCFAAVLGVTLLSSMPVDAAEKRPDLSRFVVVGDSVASGIGTTNKLKASPKTSKAAITSAALSGFGSTSTSKGKRPKAARGTR